MADRTPGPLWTGDYRMLSFKGGPKPVDCEPGTRVAVYPADQAERLQRMADIADLVKAKSAEIDRRGIKLDLDPAVYPAEGTPADEPTEAAPPGACGHPIDPNDPHMIHAAPCEARNWPESCNADACSCDRICVACCAVCGPRSIVTRYLLAAPEQGDWPWEDHCDGMAGGIVEALRAAGALVGGRSAAPTRDEVAAAIAGRHTGVSTFFVEQATTRVMALLSLSAAEPPRGRVDVTALIESLAEGLAAYEGNDEGEMHQSMARHLVGWFIAEGWRVWRLSPEDRGVAAEPNEEASDGR